MPCLMTSARLRPRCVKASEDNVAVVRVNTINPAILDAQGNVVKEDDQDIIRNALGEQIAPVETMTIQDIVANPTTDQMDGVLDTIARRINPFGVTEPVLQLMDNNRILVQLPGIRDVEEVKKLIGQTARLEFKERNCLRVTLPSGEPTYPCVLPEHYVDQETGLTGEDPGTGLRWHAPNQGYSRCVRTVQLPGYAHLR